MKTDVVDTLDMLDIQVTNIISLEKKRHELRGCKHNKLIINEGAALVTCVECGEQLDPMWVLTRMATNEATLLRKIHQQYIRLCNIETAVRRKIRTKCKHCGKFTPVNIDMKDREWMGWNKIKDD